jgi:hypothetical protein
VAALEQNPEAMGVTNRLTQELRTAREKTPEARIPDRLKIYVSFAELSNLLFASYAHNVHTISSLAVLDTSTTATQVAARETTASAARGETQTTASATAPGEAPSSAGEPPTTAPTSRTPAP